MSYPLLPRTPRRSFSGFTLIELLITLAILAVLIALAAPSFTSIRKNGELSSAANNFLAAVNAARAEGMKRNMNAMITPVNSDNDWGQGWVVFVDVDRGGTYNTGDLLIFRADAPPPYISVSTVSNSGSASENPSYLLFDGSGFAKTKTGGFGANTIQISRNDVASTQFREIRRVKVAKTGRTRVCTPDSTSDTKCADSGDEG